MINLSDISSEYKDLAKFAEDTDPQLLGEQLEDSLKKSKRRHYSLQALNPKTNYPILQLSKDSMKFQKATGQPKDLWLATRIPHCTIPHVHGQN